MNNIKRYYSIGSWSFTLLGIAHLIGHFSTPKTPEGLALASSMEEFTINMLGSSSNLLLFHEGFSLIMGILLFSYGLINLMSLNHNASVHLSNRPVLIINILTALITGIISINFFIIPIALSGIATIAFSLVHFYGSPEIFLSRSHE